MPSTTACATSTAISTTSSTTLPGSAFGLWGSLELLRFVALRAQLRDYFH